MTDRNTQPANIWDVLRRLLRCNRQQLAARLGVSSRTLARWESGEPGPDAELRASRLLIAVLRSAKSADEYAQWGYQPPS